MSNSVDTDWLKMDLIMNHNKLFTLLPFMIFFVPTILMGQAEPSVDNEGTIYTPPQFFENPNINAVPLESPPRLEPFNDTPYQLFKKQVSENHGFDYIFAYTPLFQLGEGGNAYLDAELDFGFIQNLYDDGCGTKGNILAYMLWVETFSDQPTGEFSQQYGLVTQPNSGGTDPKDYTVQLNVLAWEQSWNDEGVSLRVGQLRNDFFFGVNKYHNDDRYVFLHTVLSGLQGVNWAATGKGLGAMLDIRGDDAYMTFGFSDAKANQTYPDFESFLDGKYHYIGEFGLTPDFNGENKGEYKITLSHTARTGDPNDVTQRDGAALILSAQQDIHDQVGLSMRWNKSFERFNAGLRESLAAGVTLTGIREYKDDWISLGFFYGKPTIRQQNEEYGLELYWRAQITETIEVTPDIQFYLQRAGQPGTAVFGAFRIRILL